jgi:DNA-binding transcriptional MerR regulator
MTVSYSSVNGLQVDLACAREVDHSCADLNGEYYIGDISKMCGLSLRALRFYETRKLIKPRRSRGVRLYGRPDLLRIRMIQRGKQLGFTLTEIEELMQNSSEVHEFDDLLNVQWIGRQIEHLQLQRDTLDRAIVSLQGRYYSLVDNKCFQIKTEAETIK